MSITDASERFTALPDAQELAATVVALEEHGFSVEIVDGPDDARTAVLARIPEGSSVMTNTSVTLTGHRRRDQRRRPRDSAQQDVRAGLRDRRR